MKTACYLVSAVIILASFAGCRSTNGKDAGVIDYRKPDKYNVRFIGFDTDIDNPEGDRRSYYKVFIDKADGGRRTTGLESQEKIYEATLSPNRHLITVEKWVLAEQHGRYVKLKNIDQPNPNFLYF